MYQVEFRPRATDDLDKLDQATAARVLKKLHWLA